MATRRVRIKQVNTCKTRAPGQTQRGASDDSASHWQVRLKANSGFRTRCYAFASATLTRRRPHGHSCGVPCPRTCPARCVLSRDARHAKRTCLKICLMRYVALSGHSSRVTNAARRGRSASRRVGTARGDQGAPLSPCVVAQQCRPQPLAGKPHERCKALHSGAPVRVSQAAPAGRIVAGIRMSRARQQSAAAAGYGRFSASAKDAPSRATKNQKKRQLSSSARSPSGFRRCISQEPFGTQLPGY